MDMGFRLRCDHTDRVNGLLSTLIAVTKSNWRLHQISTISRLGIEGRMSISR
jgi:hypothetical protein